MAQTPPPFETYQSQPKKTTNPLMWVAVALVGFCCVALIAFAAMAYNGFKTVMRSAGCVLTMEMARNSIDAYVRVNGTYPASGTWQTDSQEYYKRIYDKSISKFRQTKMLADLEPPAPGKTLECQMGDQKSGIAYNSDLAGKKPDDIKDKDATVMIFETTTATMNNSAPYKPLTGQAPKMFGSKREWLTIPVAGTHNSFKSSGDNSKYSIDDNDLSLSDEELGVKPTEKPGKAPGDKAAGAAKA